MAETSNWATILSSDTFNEYDPEKKIRVRDWYFKTRIVPRAKAQNINVEKAYKHWLKKTAWIDEELKEKQAVIKKRKRFKREQKRLEEREIKQPVYPEFGMGRLFAEAVQPKHVREIVEKAPRMAEMAGAGALGSATLGFLGTQPGEQPKTFGEEIAYGLGEILPDLPIFAATHALGPIFGMGAGFGIVDAIKEANRQRNELVRQAEARKGRPVPETPERPQLFRPGLPWQFSMAMTPEAVKGVPEVAEESAKGAVIGAATGYAGQVGKLLAKETVNPLLKKAAQIVAAPALEIIALTETGAALEGRETTPKDYAHAALTLATLKGGTKTIAKFQKALINLNKKKGIHPYDAVKRITDRTTEEEFNLMSPDDLIETIKTETFEPTPPESARVFAEIDKPKPAIKLKKATKVELGEQKQFFGETSELTKPLEFQIPKIRKRDPFKRAVKREKIEDVVNMQSDEIMKSIKNFEITPDDFFADPTAYFDSQIMGDKFGKVSVERKIIKEMKKRTMHDPTDVEAEVDRMIKEEMERQEAEAMYEDVYEPRTDLTDIEPNVIEKVTTEKMTEKPKLINKKMPFAEELKRDTPPLPGKPIESGHNARYRKFLQAFESRLGADETLDLFANRLKMNRETTPEGLLRNKISKIEDLSTKRQVLYDMAQAIKLKESFDIPIGSVTKVVKQRTRKSNINKNKRNEVYPVYEYMENLLKSLPQISSLKRFTTPVAMFKDFGPEFTRQVFNRKNKLITDSKREADRIIQDIDKARKDLKIDKKSDERIMTYALTKQEGGKEILEYMGHKFKPKDFELVEPTEGPLVGTGQRELRYKLSPAEQEMYLRYRAYYKNFYERLNEVRAKSGVNEFLPVKNYFTFARQIQNALDAGIDPARAPLKNLYTDPFVSPRTTSFKYKEHRVHSKAPVDMDSHRVFKNYVRDATEHIHVSPFIAQMKEAINSKKGRFKLRESNPGAWNWLTKWLDEIAGKKIKTEDLTSSWMENKLNRLNNNLVASILAFVGRSATIQYSAYQNAFPVLGLKHSIKGIEHALQPAKRKMAMKLSNHLMIRQHDVNINEAIDSLSGKIGQAQGKIANVGLSPLRVSDQITSMAVWLGAFEKARKDYPKRSIDFARDVADNFVIDSQGSAVKGDRAPIQRTAVGRAMTAFQTFVIANANFLGREVLGYKSKRPAKETAKRVFYFTLGKSLFDSLYEDVFNMWSPNPMPVSRYLESKEEGNSVPEALRDATLEAAGYLPVLAGLEFGSDLGGALIDSANAFAGQIRDFDFTLGDSSTFLENPIFGIPGSRAWNIFRKHYYEEQKPLIPSVFGTKIKKVDEGKLKLKKPTFRLPRGF